MLLSTCCPVCRRPEGAPCPECRELLAPLGALAPTPGLTSLHAALSYQDAGRLVVHGLKYRDQRAATAWLAEQMASLLPEGLEPKVVTWAPTTARRRRQRGFDQAELLARAVARRLRLPAARLLRRRGGTPQTGRGAAERLGGAVHFAGTRRAAARELLLVDDVVTTGATLQAAAGVLRERGAAEVHGLVAAATPAPGLTDPWGAHR